MDKMLKIKVVKKKLVLDQEHFPPHMLTFIYIPRVKQLVPVW